MTLGFNWSKRGDCVNVYFKIFGLLKMPSLATLRYYASLFYPLSKQVVISQIAIASLIAVLKRF